MQTAFKVHFFPLFGKKVLNFLYHGARVKTAYYVVHTCYVFSNKYRLELDSLKLT